MALRSRGIRRAGDLLLPLPQPAVRRAAEPPGRAAPGFHGSAAPFGGWGRRAGVCRRESAVRRTLKASPWALFRRPIRGWATCWTAVCVCKCVIAPACVRSFLSAMLVLLFFERRGKPRDGARVGARGACNLPRSVRLVPHSPWRQLSSRDRPSPVWGGGIKPTVRLGEPWDRDRQPGSLFSLSPAPEAGRRKGEPGPCRGITVPPPRFGG